MKIAAFHNLPSGGAKRAFYEFSKELTKRGHTVDAFIPETANEQFLPLDEVVSEKTIYPVKKFVPFRNVKGFARLYSYSTLLSQYMCQKKIANDINKKRYDIAFIHPSVEPHIAPFILKCLEIPSVYYLQEPLRWFFEHAVLEKKEELSFLKFCSGNIKLHIWRNIRKGIDEMNTRQATRILVNSYYSHESVMRAYGLNSYVCYLGVDSEKFKPLKGVEKERFVLSVGRVEFVKGFYFIIKAISRLPLRIRPLLLLIGDACSDDQYIKIKEFANSNNVNIKIRINIHDYELVEFYNKAMMVIYAPYLEPFGFVPIESMACGTPVIAIKEGGVRESIEDGRTGLLVERDEQKFTEAIQYLLNRPKLCSEMGQQGIKTVMQKWTWEKSTDNLLEEMGSCLNI